MSSHAEKSSSDWTIETEDESIEEATVVHIENMKDHEENKINVVPIDRDNEVYEVIDKYDENANDGTTSSASLALLVNSVGCICAILCLYTKGAL